MYINNDIDLNNLNIGALTTLLTVEVVFLTTIYMMVIV